MKFILQYFLISILMLIVAAKSSKYCNEDHPDDCAVKQIHISYTGVLTEMMVTWSSVSKPSHTTTTIRWAKDKNSITKRTSNSIQGNMTEFIDEDEKIDGTSRQFIGRALLPNLEPAQTYYYQVEAVNKKRGDTCTTQVYSFRTMKEGQSWSPNLIVYGDLGYKNARALKTIVKESATGQYDGVIHMGDFGYNLHSDCGRTGDNFFNMIQPIASHLPYMVCPGNHERHNNYKQYRNRFTMPGNSESMYYSWNMGQIHFIAINSDLYSHPQYSDEVIRQYQWLKDDLQQAQNDRSIRPWIIVYAHHPFYTGTRGDCQTQHQPIGYRVADPDADSDSDYSLEKLFMNAGVDLCLWGHAHSYERIHPVYNFQLLNGTSDSPWTNPVAPIQVVAGAAGNREKLREFSAGDCDWSFLKVLNYGVARLRVENATHLHWEQISVAEEDSGTVVDSFWLIQENHGPFQLPE